MQYFLIVKKVLGTLEKLREAAREMRIAVVKMTTVAGSGHPGGSLGMADVFAALYLGGVLKFKPGDARWKGRDYFILSNGHLNPAWYAALAEAGCIRKGELLTLRKLGSRLQGHPVRGALPQVEVSTGSLGQGIGVAVGIALGMKMSRLPNRVYCSMGDGELEEGSCWEAFAAASHYKLDNLTIFIDRNGLQQNGGTEGIMALEPLAGRLAAFGLSVISADGHDFKQILAAFKKARATKGRPSVIIFKTIMGKGVSFMQAKCEWHGKALSQTQAAEALRELEK